MSELTTPVRVTVSHSEVESALRCERAHYYGYGLGIQRKSESTSLRRGTLGHQALDAYFTSLKDGYAHETAVVVAETFIVNYMTAHPFDTEIATEVLTTIRFFFEARPFRNWEVISVEEEFQLPITETLVFPFVVDLVAKDPYGDIWIIDHKFMYDFITPEEAELNGQLAKYMGALRAMGYRVDHAAYSVLRYRNIKNSTVDTRYRLVIDDPTVARLQRTFTEQAVMALRLQERKAMPLAEQSASAIRTANKLVCNHCSFRSICVAELNDTQPELVLNSEYQARTRREFAQIES